MIAFTNIPTSMKSHPHWFLWRGEADKFGRITKVPYQVSNPARKASSTKPDTWSTFEDASRAACALKGYGIGFAFQGSGIVGIDFDGCRDPETGTIDDWALTELERLDSYAEISPSGNGLHAYVFGNLPGAGKKHEFSIDGKKCAIEIYNQGRYFTVTGNRWTGAPNEVQEHDVSDLYQRIVSGEVGQEITESDGDIFFVPPELYVDVGGVRLDVEDFCRRHAIRILRQEQSVDANGGTLHIWKIECPGTHGDYAKDDGKAWITQTEDGKLAAGCWHSTCSLYSANGTPRWHDLRAMFELRPNTAKGDGVSSAKPKQKLEFQHPAITPTNGREYVMLPRERFDGWWRRGGIHLIGGASGAGKSTLIIATLDAQFKGRTFLGHEGAGLPYLVLFADRSDDAVNETLERMGLVGEITAESVPVCWGFEAAAAILKAIESHQTPPVVFVEGGDLLVEDANNPRFVAPFLSVLQAITRHYHIAIILSVGAPKSKPKEQYSLKRDRIFGSQMWPRMSETVMTIAQIGDVRELDVMHRNAAAEHFELEFVMGQLVERSPVTEREKEVERSPLWQWIAKKRGQFFFRQDAVEAMRLADAGMSTATVYRHLKTWEEEGRLEAIYDDRLEKEYLRQNMGKAQ